MLAVEADANPYSCVIFNTFPPVVLALLILFLSRLDISSSLYNQTTFASWHQFLKDGCKFARHLLEGSFNGLIFALIQMIDQLLDRLLRGIQLCSTLDQGLPLLGKIVVLFKSLLIDV
jgi:hypothetical protein